MNEKIFWNMFSGVDFSSGFSRYSYQQRSTRCNRQMKPHSFMHNGNVAEVSFRQRNPICFKIWQIARKVIPPHTHTHTHYPITILYTKFGWNWMKSMAGVAVWNSLHPKFCSKVHRMTKTEMYPAYTILRAASLNFHPFHSTIIRLQYIAHFTIFLLTHMLKFQTPTKCWRLGWLSRKVIACIPPMVSNAFII